MAMPWKQHKSKIDSRTAEEWADYRKKKDSVLLDDIPTWREYFGIKLKKEAELRAEEVQDVDLTQKVSLYSGDITKLGIDCIVNAANESLLGGGGVDGAIHRAAGENLVKECATLNGCQTGHVKITGAYDLPAKRIIHTVGPRGEHPEPLANCYRKSLQLMADNNFRSIAFPCISTGVYGYSSEKACPVVLQTVKEWLVTNHSKVDRIIFCLFLAKDIAIYEKEMQVYFPVVMPKSPEEK